MNNNHELGMQKSWSALLASSSSISREQVDRVVQMDQAERQEDNLERLARRGPSTVADFLASCSDLTFFFICWDQEKYTVVQRCGPSAHKVRSLLCEAGKGRYPRKIASAEKTNRIYNAIQILLEELEQCEHFSFVLLWRLPDDRFPQLRTSLGLSRQEGWKAIRLSLPSDALEQTPKSPPPSPLEIENEAIEPAFPSTLEPDPANCPIPWYEFQKNNPMRFPDWRWNRAFSAVQHGRSFSRKRDDVQTGHAIRFLRALLIKPQDTRLIKEKFPAFLSAHSIFKAASETRSELEARILARQPPEKIAECLSVSPSAVDAYAALFFDVRDRLHAGTYLRKQIIEPALRYNPTAGLLMFVAYHGGPVLLETVLRHLHQNGPELSPLPEDTSRHQTSLVERLALLLQACDLPQHGQAAKHLIYHFRDLVEDFPCFVPPIGLIGVFSQIAVPFSGNLEPVEAIQTSRAA